MPIIREQRRIFNQPIGVRSFDTGEAQVGNAVSRLANTMGKEFYEKAATNAEKFGAEEAQSISASELKAFDSNTGKPEVLSQMKGMGSIASASFERVVERRFVDSIDKDIRLKSAELASKYEDPVQYQSMFESYLSSMSTGAGDRFKNIIFDSGSYVMGQTKIRLADAARTKARANAAQAVGTTNIEYAETIYDSASSGDFSTSVVMIEERVTASLEAENAELYDKGYADKVRSELGSQAMSGALEVALKGATPIQQASIRVYVGSQGKAGGESLSKDQLEALKPFIGYVDRANTGALLAQANVISSNYNAVTDAKVAEERAKYEASKARFLASVTGIEYAANARVERQKQSTEDYIANFSLNYKDAVILPNRFANTTAIREAWDSGSLESIAGSIQSAQTTYEKDLKNLVDARTLGLGIDEYNSSKQDARRAGLDAVVLGMASDGNIGALKVALTTNSPADIAKLSPRQQKAIEELTKTGLYDPTEDRNYVSTLISGTQDEVQNKIEREKQNANLFKSVNDASTYFANGVFDLETLNNTEKLARNALENGDIGSTEFGSLSDGLRLSAGKGIVNIVAGNMSAKELNDLSLYVKGGGEVKGDASPHVITAGDSILAVVPAGQLSSVSQHTNSIREKVARNEALKEQQRKEQDLQNVLAANGGNHFDKTHRVAQDERLKSLGFDPANPSTYATGERSLKFFNSLRSTMPQSVIDNLNAIATGIETDNTDAYLNIFASMQNDVTTEGLFVSRFGSGEGALISPKTQALLKDIFEIYKIQPVSGVRKSASRIAMDLVEMRNDERSKLAISNLFGTLKPNEYVANRYGDLIAEDLDGVAEYLAGTNKTKEEVDARLEELVDQHYGKSRLVIDPRFPVGGLNRTSYSLEKRFPDEDRRNAFKDYIASRLPEGYRLATYIAPKETNLIENIVEQGPVMGSITSATAAITAAFVGDKPRDKTVYLVPNENTRGVAYYAFYVDENNELRPLITEINNEPYLPTFTERDLANYDREVMLAEREALEEQTKINQALQDYSESPRPTSFESIRNFLGAN